MSIYVGKNVGITLQIPVEEEILGKVADLYLWYNVTQAQTGSHEAYGHSASSEPAPPFGTEFTNTDYTNIATSNDTRYSKSTSVNGEYAIILFRYKCGFAEADVKKIKVKFEGYGTAPGGNGVTFKIWNHVSAAWEQMQTGTSGSDEELVISVSENIGNYIDDNGFIWAIVRTTNPSNGSTAAVIYCDYAHGFITKASFTVDNTPISDRDMDGVANEVEHVTVTKNGVSVTVTSVNDSTGAVVLASGDFDETDEVFCTYRYNGQPYVAQEITIEPRQTVEGIDGLGSDTIQLWAPILKDVSGSIKELLKPGSADQLKRVSEKGLFDPFDIYDTTSIWTTIQGSPGIYEFQGRKCLRIWTSPSNDGTQTKSKWKDLEITAMMHPYGAPGGLTYLYIGFREYYVGCRATFGSVRLMNYALSKDIAYGTGFIHDQWHIAKISMRGNHIKVWDDDTLIFNILDKSSTTSKEVKLTTYGQAGYFDWIEIKEPKPAEPYGIIVSWTSNGSTVKLGLNDVVFPEGSIPSPKDAPVFIVTPFEARTIKTMT